MKQYNLAFSTKDGNIPFCRFIVSLSDGRTVYENYLPGQRTAWMRLKEFLNDTKIEITKIRLQAGAKLHDIPKSDAYMVLYKECGVPGNIKFYKGIGVYTEIDQALSIQWFDEIGNCIDVEARVVEKNHPALTFSV